MADREQSQQDLLKQEADFWDQQEEAIEELYASPHDWRFAPEIGDPITKPKMNYVARLFDRFGPDIHSMIDIGCGNGWFCHIGAEAGIRAYGIDIAAKKVATAKKVADEKGLSDRCEFWAGDIMEFDPPEKVDLITANGSLHHFPDLENQLPEMVEKFLKPGGYMFFVEPHHEGMPPRCARFLLGLANTRFGRLFDKERYMQVSGFGAAEEEQGNASEEEFNLRGESPAGLLFLGEEPDMGEILKSRYELIQERYFNYIIGHFSNAFYVYMKSGFLRGLWRIMLPFTIRFDSFLCRFKRFNRYAEEGAWLMRDSRKPTGD